MTATKTTKIAALVTAICLMLSSVMMLGKTYAWFTDEAKSGDNIITSGTLDVEMSYADELNGTYTKVDDTAEPIFNYTKWEPGYTDVKYVKIANEGNLAFKYNLTLTTDETATTVDGKEVKLSEVIDVYVGTGEVKNRNDLLTMTKVGTLDQLIADPDGAAYGIMLPAAGADDVTLNPADAALVVTGEQTYCVVLHMQENAGNEYQNLSVGTGIDVLLYAEQYTWENDSFDNTYDELAGMPVADVTLGETEGLKTYLIKDIINEGIRNGVDTVLNLDTSYVFKGESPATAQESEYADWYVDFYVSLDKEPAEGLVLSGQYTSWNPDKWYAFHVPTDGLVKAGEFYPLLGTVTGGGVSNWDYTEICSGVGTFNCGAVDLDGKNNGTTMTVDLRIINPENTDETITLKSIQYTFGANTPEKLTDAIAAGGEVLVTADLNLDADTTINVPTGKTVVLDLNGHTLSGVAEGTGNREMFLVKGNLTVKNGTIEMTATQNQGWNAMSAVFDVTDGGVLTIEDAVIENEGGTDMNFCVHLNNWGEVTLNVIDSTLKAGYMPVRVFNSGHHVNNVTITGSVLDGGSYSFWVQNYVGDRPESKAEIDALLNINIFDGTNTFKTGKTYPVLYGYNNYVYYDATGALVP